MSRHCIIIPYFGKWPSYFRLFLHSCRRNPEITFLIFTDLPVPTAHPENVQFHAYTLDDVKKKLNEITSLETAITTPYKLCDVRPAYGKIFSEYITNFDFWGWGDIDIVLGKIADFLPAAIENYDVISFRKKWVSGSLCLIRNTEYMNSLFLGSSDLKLIFGNEKYFGFDEVSRCWGEVWNSSFESISFPYDNFTKMIRNSENRGDIKTYFEDHAKESIQKEEALIWDGGRLSNTRGVAFSHYHFITEKSIFYFDYPHWNTIPERFYIDRFGFYTDIEFNNRRWIMLSRYTRSFPRKIKSLISRVGRKMTSHAGKSTNG